MSTETFPADGPIERMRFRLASPEAQAETPVQLTDRIEARYPGVKVLRLERDVLGNVIAEYVAAVVDL